MTAYKIVPTEPTMEMEIDGIQAAIGAGLDTDDGVGATEIRMVYRAMLSAVPPAAENEELVERVAAGIAHRVHFDRGIGVRLTHEDSVDLARAAIRAIEGEGR